MDVGELLDYKPPQALKRAVDVDEDDNDDKSRKMRRMANAKASRMTKSPSTPLVVPLDQISEEERAEILKFVETEQAQGEVLDETSLKKIVLNFEKRSLKNREMRIKFPDSPEKFMESEVELHEILQEMRILATAPDYYPLLVKLQIIPSLLELLSHDNTDISLWLGNKNISPVDWGWIIAEGSLQPIITANPPTLETTQNDILQLQKRLRRLLQLPKSWSIFQCYM